MSSYKYVIGLIVLVAALLAVNIESVSEVYASDVLAEKSHNLIVGARIPGDKLRHREHIVKNPSWMEIVTVEKTYNVSPNERITIVEALDQKTNGNGAYASILCGGPGNSNVLIQFKSQRNYGIDFMVQLYAR